MVADNTLQCSSVSPRFEIHFVRPVLFNISRSKCNQTMKFGHLIEYNMRNIFPEELHTKCCGETSPKPFSKKSYLGITVLNFIHFVLIYVQIKGYLNILKLRCRPLAFTSYKAFLKNQKKSGTSFPVSFSAWFLKKNMSHVIFYFIV